MASKLRHKRPQGPQSSTAGRRAYHLEKRYGITQEEYDVMLAKQGGVCALCGGPPDRSIKGGTPKLAVDHNHITGKVRALVCFKCNVKLNVVEDLGFYAKALDYLRKYD